MSLKREAFYGALWTYGQQFGSQLINFAVSIVLTRVLLPEEFGLIGMITIFTGIGMTLFDGGMTSSLIRSENLDDRDYSTVFLFNLAASLLVYFMVFLLAPVIASFFKQEQLVLITRVYCLSFIFSAFGSVQNTILTKALNFRKQAMLTLPALMIGSVVGLSLAYLGFGVWSLVWMTLVNTMTASLFLFLSSRWRPQWIFCKQRFQQHFHYGYKLTLSGLLDILFTNIYQIVIGRFYSARLVGFYTRANQLMMMPVGNVSTALNKVAFPLFSKLQTEPERLRVSYKKIMQLVLFIINPIIVLMMVLAKPLVILLFTEKWVEIVPIFQVVCLTGVLYPLHLYNLLILQIKGRSDLYLKLEVAKKILCTVILAISFFFGFYGLLWGQVVFSILALIINTYYAGNMLNYPLGRQLFDILPLFIIVIIMGVVVFVIDTYLMPDETYLLKFSIGSFLGIGLYIGLSRVFNISSLLEIKNIIKSI